MKEQRTKYHALRRNLQTVLRNITIHGVSKLVSVANAIK